MKVLVLTRSTGEGHNRVAQALQEAFVRHGHECEVRDALRILNRGAELVPASDTAQDKHRVNPDVASQLYGWAAVRMPKLFGAVYGIGDLISRTRVPSPIRFLNAGHADATYDYIRDNQFDAVVATHLFPQETLSVVRRRHPSQVRYYGVLTDYSCTPFFSEPTLDGYFIPHPDMLDDCLKHGLPKNRTFPLGLPVGSQFHQGLDKAGARQSLGLPQDVPLFLLMCGGVGSTYAAQACDRLLAEGGESTHVVILAGRREDLFTSLTARYQVDPRVRVWPFTDRVGQYMSAADILVTKPGAVSSTEAGVVGLPLVHTAAIPGGEVKNARFFADHGMSLYDQRPKQAARLALWLLQDEDRAAAMRDNQSAHMIRDGDDQVAARIENPT